MKYTARVITGKGRGKRLNFPTLNLEIPDSFPYEEGIYAGWVYIDTKPYKGAFHFGPIPTFEEETPTLEVFVLDTKLPEPPGEISFELIKRLREIRRFDDITALAHQIERDAEETRMVLDEKTL